MLSDDLNATHAHWQDSIILHQIVNVWHIPGCINLVGDGLSHRDEDLPHEENDSSSWSASPDWEEAHGLHYDLFSVEIATSTLCSTLHERFADKWLFIEVIDALLGINKLSMTGEHQQATHCTSGYFIKNSKLWHLGGPTPTCAVPWHECVTKLEAV